jgi:long-chain acyl-CoA synthetase
MGLPEHTRVADARRLHPTDPEGTSVLRIAAGPPLNAPPETHLLAALWRWAEREPRRALLSSREGDTFRPRSAADVKETVRALAAGLIGLGLEAGDRVVLLSRTRIEWVLLDHAILAAGGVTVPIYDTASASQIAAILANSGARLALVETPEQREVVAGVAPAAALDQLLTIDEGALGTLRAAGSGHLDEVDARVEALQAHDLAAVLYSSGTTGEPKGCELTHTNLCTNVRQTVQQVPELFGDRPRTIVFLPLAHALGRMQVHVALDQGVETAFASSLDQLPEELGMVRPTFLVVVPRLLEKVLAGGRARAEASGRVRIYDRAMGVAEKLSVSRRSGRAVPLGVRLQHRLFDRLVYQRLRDALGGQVGAVICGGAALATEIGHRFDGIGIPVLEGFGATETSPIVSGGPAAPLHLGTVGRPYPATTIRIAEDREILIQGPQVFRGYRSDPTATAAVLRDGWYHTGDLGELTSTGQLRIIGRKKDILITAGGKNVVPGPLEDRIRAHPLVEECVVVGEGRPYVSALLWLDQAQARRLLTERGFASATVRTANGSGPIGGTLAPAAEAVLRSELDRAIEEANRTVSRAEAIGRYAIADGSLSLEAGFLTPTAKVRRGIVIERFSDHIDQLYAAR